MSKRNRRITVGELKSNIKDNDFNKFFALEADHFDEGFKNFRSGDGKSILRVSAEKMIHAKQKGYYKGIFYSSSKILNSYYFDNISYENNPVTERAKESESIVNAFRFLIIPFKDHDYIVYEDVRTPSKKDFVLLLRDKLSVLPNNQEISLEIDIVVKDKELDLKALDIRRIIFKQIVSKEESKVDSQLKYIKTSEEKFTVPKRSKGICLEKKGNTINVFDGKSIPVHTIQIDNLLGNQKIWLIYKKDGQEHRYDLIDSLTTDYVAIEENDIDDHKEIWSILLEQYKQYFEF